MADSGFDVSVDRVKAVTCTKCGRVVETLVARPLSVIPCPKCQTPVRVPGKIGEFLLTRFLGKGAMGAVFEGLDENLGRRVAIKVLPRNRSAQDERAANDLLAEARALARINHPNVVQVHSVGEHKEQPYIVMELVSGGEKLERYTAAREPMDERRALRVVADVAQGLGVAAKAHLVHGDIKPQNVLLNGDGLAKVVDFGLTQRSKETGGGTVWGTPYYIAPERARGAPCDVKADIFSLGATLFHLLTGRPPYEGKTVRDVVAARLHGGPPDPRDANPRLHESTSRLVRKLMATDPAQRPASYEDVARDARAVIDSLGPQAPEAIAPPPPTRPAKVTSGAIPTPVKPKPAVPVAGSRRKKRFVIAGVAGVAALLAVVFLWRGGGEGGVNIPSVLGDEQPFDGADLPAPWTATGATLNGAGQLLLAVTQPDQQPQASRPIGAGDVTVTLDLRPLEWNLNMEQEVAVSVFDGSGELLVTVAKSKTAYPVVRAVSRLSGEESPVGERELPFDASSLTLRLTWVESTREWSVLVGVEGSAARKLGTTTWPAPSDRVRSMRVVAKAKGTGRFTAGLDRFSLTGP